MATPIMNVIG